MKKIKTISLIVILSISSVILSGCYNKTETRLTSLIFFREFSSWQEKIILPDGNELTVIHKHSNDPYISFSHLGGIGSGDDHFSVIEFVLPPKKFRWAVARDERPIVLRLNQKQPWLVTYDRTDTICFRFYAFTEDGFATEIAAEDFPKHLAIQNMWLKKERGYRDGKPIDEYEIVAALDPTSYDFQNSLTAKMWLRIEKGIRYSSYTDMKLFGFRDMKADPLFLTEYKKKYINKITTQ